MPNLTDLSDIEFEALRQAVDTELARRRTRCPSCGGQMKLWHLHLCDADGGANMPMDGDIARALTRTGAVGK